MGARPPGGRTEVRQYGRAWASRSPSASSTPSSATCSLRGLDAIARERAALPFATEVLVLDNASQRRLGGRGARATRRRPRSSRSSAGAARPRTTRRCCSAPAGATRCCSTRTPSCGRARPPRCTTRSQATPGRGAAGARLAAPGRRARSRRRGASRAAHGAARRCRPASAAACRAPAAACATVDWAQSAALLVRREAAEQIGWLDPAFFVYSDEVDFCRRLRDAGWRIALRARAPGRPPRAALHRRRARAADRRALAQPRPLHAQAPRPGAARAVRWLTAAAVRAARRRGARPPRPRPAPLRAPRHRDAAPRARRGAARGGGGVQPPPRVRVAGPARPAPSRARAPAASPRAAASSPGRKKPRAHSAGTIAASAAARVRKPAAPAVGSEQLAPHRDPARHRRHEREPAPLERHGEQRACQRVQDGEHHHVGADEREPAPAIPSGPTSTASSATLAVRPHSAAGKLRTVTRARPAIATSTRNSP